MKDKLDRKVMITFVRLIAKTCSYLIDDCREDNKEKGAKKCVIKRKLKFENYENCLGATKLENEVNYLEKNKINLDSLKKNHVKSIRNNKSILKTQQRLKIESHTISAEETESSNDDKRRKSIESIETYAYRTSKDLLSEKKEIKCNNIIN